MRSSKVAIFSSASSSAWLSESITFFLSCQAFWRLGNGPIFASPWQMSLSFSENVRLLRRNLPILDVSMVISCIGRLIGFVRITNSPIKSQLGWSETPVQLNSSHLVLFPLVNRSSNQNDSVCGYRSRRSCVSDACPSSALWTMWSAYTRLLYVFFSQWMVVRALDGLVEPVCVP